MAEGIRVQGWVVLAIVVSIVGLVIFSKSEPPSWIGVGDVPAPLNTEAFDFEIGEAIRKARDSVDQFVVALENRTPEQRNFSVKMGIGKDNDEEHCWLDKVRYQDGIFIGQLANEPVIVTSLQIGETLSVSKDLISDWKYVDEGILVGGFTIRVMREQLSDEKRKEFDRNLSFRIEDGN